MATDEIAREVLRTWPDALYERLREAEARAADAARSPVERKSAIITARYVANEIRRAERQLQSRT